MYLVGGRKPECPRENVCMHEEPMLLFSERMFHFHLNNKQALDQKDRGQGCSFTKDFASMQGGWEGGWRRGLLIFLTTCFTGCIVKTHDRQGGGFPNLNGQYSWMAGEGGIGAWLLNDERKWARYRPAGPITYRGVPPWGRGHAGEGRRQKRKCASADLSLSFGHGRFQERGAARETHTHRDRLAL